MEELDKLKYELLDEAVFWNIIELSIKNSENIDEQEEFLISELEKRSFQEMVSFKLRVTELANKIHTSEIWCAAYLVNGGCSDDGFDYFKSWVVSRGREVYYSVKENADNLANYITEDDEDEFEFESLDYVAVTAFESKTGKDLYDYLPEGKYDRNEIVFNWEENDEESMKAICPKLFEKVDW